MVMAWMLGRGGLAVARAAASVGLEASGQMAKALEYLASIDAA